MPTLSLQPDTYLLIKLSDLERFKRLNECAEAFYLDVYGRDADAVVTAVVPPSSTLSTLPSGRIRVVLNDHPYKLNYQRVVEAGQAHTQATGREAGFEIGSFHWAGHHVIGYEVEGLKTFADPISGSTIQMVHVAQPTDIELNVDKGVVGVVASEPAAPKAKAPAKPRRRRTKAEAASAK
jgi:hypothetical protein